MVDSLYYINGCPGARAIRLLCRSNNIKVNEILIDFKKGDHMTDEFLKLNPMHTVPTLKLKNGEGIYESRLILKYLSKMYLEKSDLDLFEIDKWLFWDLGFLNTNVGKVIYPRLFLNSEPTEKDISRLVEKLDYLNNHLENKNFLIGDSCSIADLSSCMLIHNSQLRKDLVNIEKYTHICKWMKNVEHVFTKEQWNEVMGEFFCWRDSQ